MIQHLQRPKKRLSLAILLIIIASVFLAVQAMCVKLASSYLTTNFLTFARSFVNLVMLMIWFFYRRQLQKSLNFLKQKTMFTMPFVQSLVWQPSIVFISALITFLWP